MPKHIIDDLGIGSRPARSISIERDLYDKSALDDYLVTPAALTALTQLGQGLNDTSTQRAWRVVGPYGSGKSALGLVAAQLLAGRGLFPDIAQKIKVASPEVASLLGKFRRCPVAVMGSRTSFSKAIALSLGRVAKAWQKDNKAAAALMRNLDADRGTYRGHELDGAIGVLMTDFADAAAAQGFDGVVVFVDELGKFVEHAAMHPESGDLMALQQLAECASGASEARVSVVAMLHQHFSGYATGVGRGLSDEWEKVASRFEEIPFDEPIERYALFAANALSVGAAVAKDADLRAYAVELYAKAVKLDVVRPHSLSQSDLFENAHRLFPIHPLVIAALAIVAKRFGQSERSFHAFLRGNEPFALRSFAAHTIRDVKSWYRLAEAFDYLKSGNGLRFRDRNVERRWAFSLSCVERQGSDPVLCDVLKVIAVLELVQLQQRLPISSPLVHFAMDHVEADVVDKALHLLVERGVLFTRRDGTEYTIAVAEAANIEAMFEAASKREANRLAVKGAESALAKRFIVANKHYDRQGTLRTMGVVVGTPKSWPKIAKRGAEDLVPDGWLHLLLVTEGTKEREECEKQFAQDKNALSLHACLVLSTVAKAALSEYAAWLIVEHELATKKLDPWATDYVFGRVQEARANVERLVVSEVSPTPERGAPAYWHMGNVVADSTKMNLSRLASWLFDTVFMESPRLINELINKDKPPSAITLARQRMFELLFDANTSKPLFAPTEYPPERLIHHSLLRDTGMWEEQGGTWALKEPSPKAPVRIWPIWKEISTYLSRTPPATMADVIEALAAPPFGIRAAPAGAWATLYLMVNKNRCAIMERGTLVLEMTSEHVQRMLKNPGTVVLREFAQSDDNSRLLLEYRAALATVGVEVDTPPTYLDVARAMYRWFSKLPPFAAATLKLDKHAIAVRYLLERSQDPIKLLREELPRAHLDAHSTDRFDVWLSQVLTEIATAQRRLQDAVGAALAFAFEVPGPISRLRAQLLRESAEVGPGLAEPQLKSFIMRCADQVLTDERWLDSIASLVVQRPLDAWDDETLARFETSLSELCGHYKRWIKVIAQRARNPKAGERFVSVTLTLPGGEESSLFLVANDRAKAMASAVLAEAMKDANNDRTLVSTALAQALLDLQNGSAGEKKREGQVSGKQ